MSLEEILIDLGIVLDEDRLESTKVMQIYLKEEPVLLFCYYGDGKHATALKLFLEDKCISFKLAIDSGGRQVPALIGDDYRVVGAGRARVDKDKKTIELFDRSEGYEIGINLEHTIALQRRIGTEYRLITV